MPTAAHSHVNLAKPLVKFYEFLGMTQINKMDYPDMNFSLYFMGYPESCGQKNWTNCEALVELTHNHGTENDPNFQVASGNADPGKGFGHLCVTVDNIQAACDRLEKEGYSFQKKLTDGRMRHIAFVKDPDG
jgi:lactoylglutathione lyase